AHGGDQSRSISSQPFYRSDPLGRSSDSIITKMHRRRTRVVCPANECQLQAALAGDGVDNPQRSSQFLQDRTLLDMELDVGKNIAFQDSLWNFASIQPKVLDRLAHGDSLRIAAVQEFLVEAADKRATTDERCTKANSLLLRKANNFNCKRKPALIQNI